MLDEELNFIDPPKVFREDPYTHWIEVSNKHCMRVREQLVLEGKIRSIVGGRPTDALAFATWNGSTQEVYVTTTDQKTSTKIRQWFQLQNAKRGWIVQIMNLNKNPKDKAFQ